MNNNNIIANMDVLHAQLDIQEHSIISDENGAEQFR